MKAIDLDLASVLVGMLVSSFGALLSHQLTLYREKRSREAISDGEREELLSIIPKQSHANRNIPEERIRFTRMLELTAWTPSRLGMRVRELEAAGKIARLTGDNHPEWFVPHPEGMWGKHA